MKSHIKRTAPGKILPPQGVACDLCAARVVVAIQKLRISIFGPTNRSPGNILPPKGVVSDLCAARVAVTIKKLRISVFGPGVFIMSYDDVYIV